MKKTMKIAAVMVAMLVFLGGCYVGYPVHHGHDRGWRHGGHGGHHYNWNGGYYHRDRHYYRY